MDSLDRLEELMPEIRRSRDHRLYDHRGNRYLDLWRNGGRALLGHRPGKAYAELKRVLQKGVVAEYPSPYGRRLKKALNTLVPGNWEVRLFANEERALTALNALLGGTARGGEGEDFTSSLPAEPFDVAGDSSPPIAVRYRPFLPLSYERSALVLPVLPFPGKFAPQPLLIGRPFTSLDLPPDDPVSPVLAAALAKVVWYLIRMERSPKPAWDEWALPGYRIVSCYGIPRFPEDRYREVFEGFLERRILIPPTPREPLVLPMEWSRGERLHVQRAAQEVLGKGGVYGNG